MEAGDPSGIIKVRQRPGALAARGVFGLVTVLIYLLVLFSVVYPVISAAAPEDRLFAWVSAIVLTLLCLVLVGFVLRTFLWALRGPVVVVTLSPEGYFDSRTMAEPVPWNAVRGVRRDRSTMKLLVSRDMGQQIIPNPVLRLIHQINQFSRNVVVMTTGGLEMDLPRLTAIAQRYASAHGGRSLP